MVACRCLKVGLGGLEVSWGAFGGIWGRTDGCAGPNGRQNQRRRRSFCRSKRLFQAKRTAKPAAVPFILPFKTAILGQTDGKTSAVHSAVQNGYFRPKRTAKPTAAPDVLPGVWAKNSHFPGGMPGGAGCFAGSSPPRRRPLHTHKQNDRT